MCTNYGSHCRCRFCRIIFKRRKVMLSPFGEWVRPYRQKNQISLREMARTLGKTPSFLSAVELGRKSAPSNLFGMICAQYRLTEEEIEELQKSLENSKKEVRIGKNWKSNPTSNLWLDEMIEMMSAVASLFNDAVCSHQCKMLRKARAG